MYIFISQIKQKCFFYKLNILYNKHYIDRLVIDHVKLLTLVEKKNIIVYLV